MNTFKTVAKILTALAAVAGVVYVVATYGDKIVAWAKKLLASCPCTCECEAEASCECDASECCCEGTEEACECECCCEAEAPAEETCECCCEAAEETAPVAEEADFEG